MQPPPEGQPQQPYYPPGYPPQPPPPKKRRRRWPFVLLGVVILCCAILGIIIATSSKSTNTGTAVSTSTTSASTTPTSAPPGQHAHVGQVVKVGDTWDVTVNRASTSQGDEFTKPKAGNQFVIVDVTLKNLSAQEQNVSSALSFSLLDATGQKYTETILSGETPPDGKVEAGSLLRGQLSYEVPTSQKALTFSFQSDILGSGQTIWDLKV